MKHIFKTEEQIQFGEIVVKLRLVPWFFHNHFSTIKHFPFFRSGAHWYCVFTLFIKFIWTCQKPEKEHAKPVLPKKVRRARHDACQLHGSTKISSGLAPTKVLARPTASTKTHKPSPPPRGPQRHHWRPTSEWVGPQRLPRRPRVKHIVCDLRVLAHIVREPPSLLDKPVCP